MISDKVKKEIIELQNQYPEKRSALIPALHLAQEEVGYLPTDVQQEIATLFNIDQNEVNAVVTFYDMFFEEKKGRQVIHCCKNLSCMLRGSDPILRKLIEKLGIRPGETTKDGKYTLVASECLALCDKAPVILIDEKLITEDQLEGELHA